MRSMMSEMLVDMYKELGAVPLSISYSELYTSLQTGMVEAQDNGFVPTESDGFTEVLKNVCVSNHFYAGGVVVVADDWLGRSARRGSEIDQRCSERSRESTESLSARRKTRS